MLIATRANRLLLCGLVASVGLAACGGGGSRPTGFCATIRTGHRAFDHLDAAHAEAALAEFDRVAASAPQPVRSDLEEVSSFNRALRRDPAAVAKHPEQVKSYAAASKRVDAYLHDTCGVQIPPPGKL